MQTISSVRNPQQKRRYGAVEPCRCCLGRADHSDEHEDDCESKLRIQCPCSDVPAGCGKNSECADRGTVPRCLPCCEVLTNEQIAQLTEA